MPLEDLTRIDIISIGDDGRPTLVITDAGVTTDPEERFELLIKKFGLYMAAIEDEEFRKDFPGRTISDFQIRVVCAEPPTERMLALTAIAPKGEHHKKIRVEFEHAPIGGAKSTPLRRKPLEPPELSEQFAHFIDMSFVEGVAALKDNEFVTQAMWFHPTGVSNKTYVEFADTHQAIKAARESATHLSDASFYSIICDGIVGTDDGGTCDALIVEAYERGQEKGVIYALSYRPKAFLRKFKVIERQYLGLVDNVLV